MVLIFRQREKMHRDRLGGLEIEGQSPDLQTPTKDPDGIVADVPASRS
jgi:hypothetical protein